MPENRASSVCLLAAAWLLPLSVAAIQTVVTRLPVIESPDWRVAGAELHLGFGAQDGLDGRVRITELELPGVGETLRDIEVRCGRIEIRADSYRCRQGSARIGQWRDESLTTALDLTYGTQTGAIELVLADLGIAGGRVDVRLDYRDGRHWRVQARGDALSLVALQALLDAPLPGGLEFGSGLAAFEADLRGDQGRLQRIALQTDLTDLAFSNAAGLIAAEDAALELGMDAVMQGGNLTGQARARIENGGLFIDPVYTEFVANPLQANGQFELDPAGRRLDLRSVEVSQAQTFQLGFREVELGFAQDPVVRSASLDIDEVQLQRFFPAYVAPWLAATSFSDISMSGSAQGRVDIRDNALHGFEVQLASVDWSDPGERLSLSGLSGDIGWDRAGTARSLPIRWQAGSVYGFALGPAELTVNTAERRYWLADSVEVGLIDGSLVIDELSLTRPGREDMEWSIDAVLTPVSMQRVTAALDWPSMQGQLSGVIPEISYADGRVNVGGILLIRVFDGTVRLRNVELQQPFGLVPRLQADIDLDNLDLQQLTSTFSFGEIAGRLSGGIAGLRMEDWQPVAFDARLATPEGDDSRHRISQKAVDNLSSIGGGVGGVLSKSFLGIFEEFPYARLGISCRLRDDICEMGGLGPANGGYYLVKGRWLPPRINIIGYAEQVDWDVLIDRLQAATAGGAPELGGR